MAATDLLSGEAKGFAIDATAPGGTVSIIGMPSFASDRNNVTLAKSNLVNGSASAKYVRDAEGNLILTTVGQIPQSYHLANARYGILVEPTATNIMLRSEEADNAFWGKTRSSVLANQTTAPNGATTADLFREDTTASATHLLVGTNVTITANTVYTASAFVKRATGNRQFALVLNNGVNSCVIGFGLDGDGTVGTSQPAGAGTFTAAGIEKHGNGWYRCWMAGAVNAGLTAVSMRMQVRNSIDNATYTGDGASGLYIWGMQLELGSVPSSYIPTTTAAVVRDADVISVPLSGIPWSDIEGTIYLDYATNNVSAGLRYGWEVYKDTNNRISYYGTAADPILSNRTASNQDVAIDLGTLTTGTRTQISSSWAENDFDGSKDGAAASSDGTATLTTGYTTLYLGKKGSATTEELSGHIHRLVYVPRHVHIKTGGGLPTWRYNFEGAASAAYTDLGNRGSKYWRDYIEENKRLKLGPKKKKLVEELDNMIDELHERIGEAQIAQDTEAVAQRALRVSIALAQSDMNAVTMERIRDQMAAMSAAIQEIDDEEVLLLALH